MPNTLDITIDDGFIVIVVSTDDEDEMAIALQPDEAFVLSVKLARAAKALTRYNHAPPKSRSDA